MTTHRSHIEKILEEHANVPGIRLGDFVEIENGLERVCVIHKQSKTLQTTLGTQGSWFLFSDGFLEFSGSCINFDRDRKFDKISIDDLECIGEVSGNFWTFKDGVVCPGGRVDFSGNCRLFKIVSKT